jgi:uncharacterized protein (TIGR03435 family)
MRWWPERTGRGSTPEKEDGETENGGSAHLIDSRGMTMRALALCSVSRPRWIAGVFDMAALTGVFDVTLDFETEDKSAADAASCQSIFAALQEQLGLKLEP